jgi:MarR family transcriptional regulator, organic hydroperoxide resistance regulator
MKSSAARVATESLRSRAVPTSKSFRIADYPFYRIARVAGLYSVCLERELKPRGMDQPRWRVLMILNEHNPASMGLIAQMAVMKLPTVLKLVQRMTEEGLVRNAPRASDQRVTEASITASGRRALVMIKRVAADVYGRATAKLSLPEIEQLNAILGHVEQNLEVTRREHRLRSTSRTD